ncbi:hypothetical protein [Agaribacter flavus]|uniref:Uncharacterized protein n=1 Tax=Agaribacter flavus TaxID=1902781 RepID=A0ABV7FPW8_9ALTE
MMNNRFIKSIITSGILVFSFVASGQVSSFTELTERVSSCSSIENDAQRLICYDKLFKPLHHTVTTADKSNGQSVTTSQSVNAAPVSANGTEDKSIQGGDAATLLKNNLKVSNFPQTANEDLPYVPAPTPTSLPPSPLTTSNDDGFGSENLKKSTVTKPQEITSTITKITKTLTENRIVNLDNGQAWRETQLSRLRLKEGETITIRKGAFSSYLLSKEGVNRSMRVKRIK